MQVAVQDSSVGAGLDNMNKLFDAFVTEATAMGWPTQQLLHFRVLESEPIPLEGTFPRRRLKTHCFRWLRNQIADVS
jgi:hypothetical protein